LKGRVIRSTGSWYSVQVEHGETYECKIKGTFRMKGIKTTNPLAVGDHVEFEIQKGENIGVINTISPRKNFIIRKSTNLSKISHIIAANIDQAFLVATLASPRTSTGFIDRFLVTSEAYHIPARLVFNKSDLLSEEQNSQMDEVISVYENVGYPCFKVSAQTCENLGLLKSALEGKVNLFTGHSGVGKSTLINKLDKNLNLKTGEISEYHKKGKHITTFAQMLPLCFGGYIIDTPGIKEFGLRNFKKEEVAERFPEMRKLMWDCKYSNCTHVHEPDCAVKKAVALGDIDPGRYFNYLDILEDEYFGIKEWESK
jgi:ribosome biogenesis GTPase / thiamine phosphate phosphatase